MKKRSSSQKRNSKSLLSTTIEQIKKDLKEDYYETPLKNFQYKQKKINKKNFVYPMQESEKTNNENMNYNDIDLSKIKNKKSLNINTNISNYNEKNNIFQNKYVDYYQISQEKNKNYFNGEKESKLQKQIKDLKIKSQNMKDKLTIFLKLMKKYSSKLSTLARNNFGKNSNEEKKGIINKEIKSTLRQLNKMLNNPKLNEDIFEIEDLTMNNISSNYDLSLTNPNNNYNLITTNQTLSNNKEDLNENVVNSNIIATEINSAENEDIKNEYVKDIEGLIEKYEEKINLLNSENINLKKNNIEQNNYVKSLISEVNELKEKLKQDKKNYENNLTKLNNDSIILQKKVDFLQDENNILKKNCVELTQNLSKINYLEKTDTNSMSLVEKELEFKNNVIKYLESLLKNSGINTGNYNFIMNSNRSKKSYLNENINNKFSKTNKDLDFNNITKNEESNRQYFTFYNMNPKSINASKNSSIKNSQDSNLFSPIAIQKEIDDIDKEIVDLQKQLKQLLDE